MEFLLPLSHLIASVLFIIGIKMMGEVSSAKKGNYISAVGMVIAVCATWLNDGCGNFLLIFYTIIAGVIVGVISAATIAMAKMPQMVALFNGFGGLASCLVGIYEFANFHDVSSNLSVAVFVNIAVVLSILIGGITFSGSLIAYLKLNGKFKSVNAIFSEKSFLAKSIAITFIYILLLVVFKYYSISAAAILSLFAFWLGILFVVRIGGGDMPVIIALLNSFSGLAASFAGFTILNYALIIAGCLVGASGLILTFVMCRSMNRSLKNVFFDNFGLKSACDVGLDGVEILEPRAVTSDDAFHVLEAARNIIFVPGYGMAVSQAQHALKELADLLKNNGSTVKYAIHPVAGRMPGHMNVLLAEASIPYDELVEIGDVNRDMEDVDVAVVIGANDVVNPAAVEDINSPIYGMPTIEVSRSKNVFILKRGTGTGFSGIVNSLFSKPNASMIYGDAKSTLLEIASKFK